MESNHNLLLDPTRFQRVIGPAYIITHYVAEYGGFEPPTSAVTVQCSPD